MALTLPLGLIGRNTWIKSDNQTRPEQLTLRIIVSQTRHQRLLGLHYGITVPLYLLYYISPTPSVGDQLLPDALDDVQAVLVDDVAFVIAQLPPVLKLLGGLDRGGTARPSPRGSEVRGVA